MGEPYCAVNWKSLDEIFETYVGDIGFIIEGQGQKRELVYDRFVSGESVLIPILPNAELFVFPVFPGREDGVIKCNSNLLCGLCG